MAWLGVIAAAVLIGIVILDTFETMLLPRRVRHGYRLARLYYRSAWFLWRSAAKLLPPRRWRNALLGVFGPLSLLGLIAVWATTLITGFALLYWSLHSTLSSPRDTDDGF